MATITIHTLTTDDGTEAVTSVFTDYAALAQSLRDNFDATGEFTHVSDDHLPEALANGALLITTGMHTLTVPAPDFVDVLMAYVEDALDDLDEDLADAIAALPEETVRTVLDDAYQTHAKSFAFLRNDIVDSTLAALEDQIAA